MLGSEKELGTLLGSELEPGAKIDGAGCVSGKCKEEIRKAIESKQERIDELNAQLAQKRRERAEIQVSCRASAPLRPPLPNPLAAPNAQGRLDASLKTTKLTPSMLRQSVSAMR